MAYESNSIFWVEVEKIIPNPYQPRKEFDEQKLNELAESIRMYGVLQPLVVTKKEIIGDDGSFRSEYELIAGERRLRASRIAGLGQVPVIIRSGEETELMKLELAIIENLQREDLNPVDRAIAFKQLAESFGLSHAEVGRKVGKSREYVSNSIRLLQLPDTVTGALRRGDISDGHARSLLMLNDKPEEQDVVFREILLKKLSVREVERITRKIAADKVRKKNWEGSDPELIAMERKFTETLGTRVQILKTDYGGRLQIDYFSPDDLDKILALLEKEKKTAPEGDREALESIAATTPLSEDIESDRAMEAPFEEPAAGEGAPAPAQEGSVREDAQARPEPARTDAVTPAPPEEIDGEIVPEPEEKKEEHIPEPEADDTEEKERSTAPEPEERKEDEEELYSIRNFSL